jgi:hypothetical protein
MSNSKRHAPARHVFGRWVPVGIAAAIVALIFVQAGIRPAEASATLRPGTIAELRAGPPRPPSRIGPPAASTGARTQAATATFIVSYSGFSAPARAAFQAAVDIWASQISSPVPIRVNASWTPLGADILGSAGASNFARGFSGAPVANTWYPIALANKLAGTDLAPADADIDASFSSAFPNWYFGTDGNTPAGEYDLMTVVLHELGHGLGFVGSASVSAFGSGSIGLSGFPVIYDRFAVNGSNQSLVNRSLFPNGSLTLGDQLTGSNLFFNGANASAVTGGQPRLYAPPAWQQGSSYSHLDENTYPAGNPNSLMTPQLDQGESILDPGPITRGIFADMGWNKSSTAPTATPTRTPTRTPTPRPTGTPSGAPERRVFVPVART